MSFFDTHAHLNLPDFDGDIDAVVKRALENHVLHVVVPGTNIGDSGRSIELAERFDGILFSAVGIHPHEADGFSADTLARLKELVLGSEGKVVAVGEIGLDFYRNFSSRESQLTALEEQIELAIELSLPIIIHVREAFPEIFEVLAQYREVRGIFHCFSGGPNEVEKALEFDFYISFAGNITYKKSHKLVEALRLVPDNRLLIETDSPYLAPAPYRGKRNEPSFLTATFAKIKEVKQASDSLENLIFANSLKAFGLTGG